MSQFIPIEALVSQSFRRQREIERVAKYGAVKDHPVTLRPAPVEQWSAGKLMAMLMIYRSDFAIECIAKMQGIKASQDDFLSLRNEGLACKRELARFHELTPEGRSYGLAATKHAARKLGLHHLYDNSYASVRYASVTCSCGWHRSYDRRFGGVKGQMQHEIGAHLEAFR